MTMFLLHMPDRIISVLLCMLLVLSQTGNLMQVDAFPINDMPAMSPIPAALQSMPPMPSFHSQEWQPNLGLAVRTTRYPGVNTDNLPALDVHGVPMANYPWDPSSYSLPKERPLYPHPFPLSSTETFTTILPPSISSVPSVLGSTIGSGINRYPNIHKYSGLSHSTTFPSSYHYPISFSSSPLLTISPLSCNSQCTTCDPPCPKSSCDPCPLPCPEPCPKPCPCPEPCPKPCPLPEPCPKPCPDPCPYPSSCGPILPGMGIFQSKKK